MRALGTGFFFLSIRHPGMVVLDTMSSVSTHSDMMREVVKKYLIEWCILWLNGWSLAFASALRR